jgi:hypothetical protein
VRPHVGVSCQRALGDEPQAHRCQQLRHRAGIGTGVGAALLATTGLVVLVFSIIEAPDAGWLSARTVGGIAAGLAALAVFAAFELRRRHPLLDPRCRRR